MKYLQHVMDETLRLYPAVPFNVRMSLKDTYLPHGGGEDGLEVRTETTPVVPSLLANMHACYSLSES